MGLVAEMAPRVGTPINGKPESTENNKEVCAKRHITLHVSETYISPRSNSQHNILLAISPHLKMSGY
jgi:hypothetical protein